MAPATASPFEPWVQPLVYGGFAWQAVFLGAAFLRHARSRWPLTGLGSGGPVVPVVAGGGAAAATLSAGLYVLVGGPIALVTAALTAAGAIGVLGLARGRRSWWWLTAAWTGSAVMFAWGLYGIMLATTGALGGLVDPMTGLAQLTGLLGGFALAVAGLLVLIPAPRREMAP